MELYISHGVNVNQKTAVCHYTTCTTIGSYHVCSMKAPRGWTALKAAAIKDRGDIVKMLIRKGDASINPKDTVS